jgi:hypothetical protein
MDEAALMQGLQLINNLEANLHNCLDGKTMLYLFQDICQVRPKLFQNYVAVALVTLA